MTGASRLVLHPLDGNGVRRLDMVAAGSRLWMPRLRLARGQPLTLNLRVADAGLVDGGRAGWVHVVHFSGGRRVGGGSVHVVPAHGD